MFKAIWLKYSLAQIAQSVALVFRRTGDVCICDVQLAQMNFAGYAMEISQTILIEVLFAGFKLF